MPKKPKFIKLKKSGAVVFVLKKSSTDGVIHGCNLASPSLRTKTYPEKMVDTEWDGDPTDLRKALKPSSFYKATEKGNLTGKPQNTKITRQRLKEIRGIVEQMHPVALQTA